MALNTPEFGKFSCTPEINFHTRLRKAGSELHVDQDT